MNTDPKHSDAEIEVLRRSFEDWARKTRAYDLRKEDSDPSCYMDVMTMGAWVGWKARDFTERNERQPVPEFDRFKETSRRNSAVEKLLARGWVWSGDEWVERPTMQAKAEPVDKGCSCNDPRCGYDAHHGNPLRTTQLNQPQPASHPVRGVVSDEDVRKLADDYLKNLHLAGIRSPGVMHVKELRAALEAYEAGRSVVGDSKALQPFEYALYAIGKIDAASSEGEASSVSRPMFDALTTMGWLEKVGRNNWIITPIGKAAIAAKEQAK